MSLTLTDENKEKIINRITELAQDNHALREQRDIAVRQLSDMQTENERLRAECGLRQIRGFHEGMERAAEIADEARMKQWDAATAIRAKLEK